MMTRFEARAYAREAYKEGVRYIGGCCFCTPYHIRYGRMMTLRGMPQLGHSTIDRPKSVTFYTTAILILLILRLRGSLGP